MNTLTISTLSIFLSVLLISGCYHAKITTGEAPSSEIYEQPWATSWIGGLVPPDVVNAGNECTDGVAQVETKHSFLNMLVGSLTLGIYTPMHITVTCADGASAALSTPQNSVLLTGRPTEKEIVHAFQIAVDHSLETGRPVFIHFID